jgi:hypothetical protein
MNGGNKNSEWSGRWVYVGESIEVSTAGDLAEPANFNWQTKHYKIAEILLSWFDWNFPAGAIQRNWKSRRHRKYYRVNTSSGEIFEIYRDRKNRNPADQWVCYQRWQPERPNTETDSN